MRQPPQEAPHFRSRQFRDFDEIANAMERWDQRFHQLSRGPCDAGLRFFRSSDTQWMDISVNQVIQARGNHPAHHFVIVPVTATNDRAVWLGHHLEAGSLVIVPPGHEHDHLTCKGERLTSVAIDENFLHNGLASLGHNPEAEACFRAPAVWRSLFVGPAASQELQTFLAAQLDQFEAQPGILGDVAEMRRIELDLVEQVASLLRPAHDDQAEATRTRNRRHIVRRAEEFIVHHLGERLSMVDLCRELDVSERTLHYAFHEQFGMSPMAYVKVQRLNQVRHELKSVDADPGTVTDIAKRWGFVHPGNFAADYRRRFGELPSQTLRRQQGEQHLGREAVAV